MKRMSSETELIWNDNKDAFVIAGKKFKADQDISILKQIAEYDEIEDKLELWNSFDYKHENGKQVVEANALIYKFVSMGMNVLIKYTKRYGYDYNLSIHNEDDWSERDPSFDAKEKLFDNEGDDLCEYATRLVKQGEVMLCKENNKIKIQVVPSHVLYIINNTSKYIMHSLKDENYFSKFWGKKPTTISCDFKYFKLEYILKILWNEPTINKIILKNNSIYFTEFESLLASMEKNQTQKAFYSYF